MIITPKAYRRDDLSYLVNLWAHEDVSELETWLDENNLAYTMKLYDDEMGDGTATKWMCYIEFARIDDSAFFWMRWA